MKVVLVHGFLGSAMNWGPIVSKLRAHPEAGAWDVQALELLGHGRRGQEAAPRPLDLAAVTEDLARQISEGPFVGVGHSFGLRPLLRLAAREPARFLSLIAEDSSPLLSGPGTDELRRIFTEVPVPFASREAAKSYFDAAFGRETAMSKFLLSNIRERVPGQHDWRFQREALWELLNESIQEPLWKEWEGYSGPAGMILGKGGYVTEARVEECRRRRKAPLEVAWIEGAGHWVHADQPTAFVDSLVKMIRQQVRG